MNKLQAERIRRSLSPELCQSLVALDTFDEIASTNTYLLEVSKPSAGRLRVAIANTQTQGRGRHGKDWYSPAGAGLWLSLAYTFSTPPTRLAALTLAVGASLAEELRELGVDEVELKWPNDLLVGGRKLGGILLESCAGGMTAIIGIGINIALPKNANSHIKTGIMPIDLRELLPRVPGIESLAAASIERLGATLQRFDRDGFGPFVAAWSAFDALVGKDVVVQRADTEQADIVHGIAHGIAADGALMVHGEEGIQRIVSGSVRLIDCEEAVA